MNTIDIKKKKLSIIKLSFFFLSFLFVQPFVYSQSGEKLFKANCAACHSVGENTVVGPGLQGINDKYSEEWLIKWTTNSQELINSGDADAIAIFEEFNSLPMPPQAVNPDEIKAILAYIASSSTAPEAGATDDCGKEGIYVWEGQETPEPLSSTSYMFIAIALVLAGLVFMLNRYRAIAAKMVAKKEGKSYEGPISLLDAFKRLIIKNKGIAAGIIIIAVFGGLVDLMFGAMEIGVHQDYKPEQEIKFSHKVHAGCNQIDCNYCHSSARHSKTSGIPSLNVCMNCHKFVNGGENTFVYNGKEYPMSEEIQKIYTALDYDPNTGEYGDNPTPVKWIKVHNLPDHAFFSHSQHVTAGNLKCQKCHGPVEDMDVVGQFSPLTMGWCINCHRETKVSTEGNGYYDDLHSRMTPEFRDKVMKDGKITVNEIGGLECAKCHY